MCGIVGYIGKQDALPILLDGLKNLEYRGYDSAGIMVFGDQGLRVVKAVGKVSNLEDKVEESPRLFNGKVGIAHTRWATHGRVTETNAHPHWDCKGEIFVVHNGIIENYKELKSELLARGHTFVSETDTEVVVHLFEEIKRKSGLPLEEAVRMALSRVRGTYGIVVFDIREPKKIVAARNFSPLLVGIGRDEFIVASDATAILKLTKQVVYLHDGEIVSLSPEEHRIFTIRNEPVARPMEQLEWDIATAQKGGFPHFMLKEIHEQADAIRNSIRGRLEVNEGKSHLGD
jgi:glucosamine--fructose-6-phosphate aminotransferase (isomerizing)